MSDHFTHSELEPWHLPHMRHRANDAEWPDTRPAYCTQECEQGRHCACEYGTFDLERQNPWVTLLYAAALVLAIVASAFWPMGFAL